MSGLKQDAFDVARRKLVDDLKLRGYLKSQAVERAMLSVPRELFVPEGVRDRAYEDRPLPIGYGQTISAPSVVAYMTELLEVSEGMKVLEVGTGSGYQAAILAMIVGDRGHVWTVERIAELASRAKETIESLGLGGRVTVIVGDGSLGYPPAAPYDRIIVTAASPKVPRPLVEQLAEGGLMVIPVGSKEEQALTIVRKREGQVFQQSDIEVLFVPLVGAEAWDH
ncbi:protein-L-isoaspartate(D-aspartate) O-methyltransferase [Acidilobus sp.]|uniref:protein-L-isoaspartate(D-aspartate) O-methyltransferase n=1 Tax=Acidilobus sp. TaxID=1872109 RepID=UPI003D008D59